MTVLHIGATAKVGGGSEYLYSLISECAKKYPFARMVVALPRDGAYFDMLISIGVTVYEVQTANLSISIFSELLKIAKREKVDIIHSQGKGAGIYARLLGLAVGAKVVHSFHGFHFEHFGFLKQKIYLWSERLFSLVTSVYLCVSNDERKKIIKNKACFDLNKLLVVYNGINPKRVEKVFLSRDALGLSDKDIIIVTLARIVQQKGILDFVESARILASRHENIKFIIVGDVGDDEFLSDDEKSYRDAVFANIEKYNLDSAFSIVKKTPMALDYLNCSDVYLSSSLGEGFSLSLLEAMLLKKPIVATDVTGNSEALDHEINAIKVACSKPKQSADGVSTILNNPDFAISLGANARQKALAEYSFESMISKTMEVYIGLLNDNSFDI